MAGVKLAPGANAVGVAKRVRAVLDEAQAHFPPGVRYEVAYDSSRFVGIAIEQVVKTLLEAVVLVFLVMMLFMQNLRATLIPTLVVPIALLGTFAVMLPMGFSINVLTLFGLVLAIGILVDDAIVVVENVERVMHEEGLSPRDATASSTANGVASRSSSIPAMTSGRSGQWRAGGRQGRAICSSRLAAIKTGQA